MEFHSCGHAKTDLLEYASLFSICFPKAARLASLQYLEWLYAMNPCGSVVGFNARHEGRLVAHYACIPVRIDVEGVPKKALLSLNTATHPDFQGKGLFVRLAELTYLKGVECGFDMVYGVANANSTPGFVRKLGFTLISPLEARVGFGSIGRFEWARLSALARFKHHWDAQTLAWRSCNPAACIELRARDAESLTASAPTGRFGLRAWAEMPCVEGLECHISSAPDLNLRVWLGLMPEGIGKFSLYPELPTRFRPSPLNLIIRRLDDASQSLCAREVFFNFLDFDAF